MCIEAPESITNSLSSGNFAVGAGVARTLWESKTWLLSAFLSLQSVFRQVPRDFAGASCLLWGDFSSPQTWARKDYAHEAHALKWSLWMDHFFTEFLNIANVLLEKFTAWSDPNFPAFRRIDFLR